jgi:hypothetical protein
VSERALASYDALQLAANVASSADGASEGELHTLAYLSCLLAVFNGNPPVWWGYPFTATRAGAPFAHALREAIQEEQRAGLLVLHDRVLRPSDAGNHELRAIRPLILNRRRVRYLEAASATALAMPLPSVSDALSFEPGLRRALRFVRTKALLDQAGLDLLANQFRVLEQALDDDVDADLLVPSVVWLTYLSQQRPADIQAA